ncbi:nodulation protein NfeD [Dehalococcoidia bacterium]|nr:nodulation protein NfeD [Dehalococcoidia bacterium]
MRKCMRIFFLLIFILGILSAGMASAASPVIHVLQVDGIIVPVVADFIDQGITEAEDRGAAALVIKLNTPGGIVPPTRDIVERILAARVPVVVYVDRWAGSAGTFITLASHVAAMAPGSNIGAATPVALGEGEVPDEAQRKAIEDAAAWIRSIAEMRGRNPEQADLTVTEGKSFTDSEALEANLIDLRADSLQDLISQLDGMEVTIHGEKIILNTEEYVLDEIEMTLVQRFLHAISDPNIAYILLSIGSLGLILELYSPGTIFPGVIGAISLLLAFYSLAVLEAYWAGIILILLAFALFATEVFVASGGLLTGGGLAALIFGSLILFDGRPAMLDIDWWLIAIVAVSVGAFFIFVVQAVVRTQRRKQPTGQEGLIGMVAEVKSALNPRGTVFVHGELWEAILDEGQADPGEEVTVTDVRGLKLRVIRNKEEVCKWKV